VRPEAAGHGYATFEIWSRPPSTTSPGPAVSPLAEWEAVSEKALNRLAARKAMRTSMVILASLLVVVLLCRYSDWPARVLVWLRYFPALTQ